LWPRWVLNPPSLQAEAPRQVLIGRVRYLGHSSITGSSEREQVNGGVGHRKKSL
jgi:hypothetical protein